MLEIRRKLTQFHQAEGKIIAKKIIKSGINEEMMINQL